MSLDFREAAAQFADLICDDPQWLRAEFDELMSASFGEPPAQPPAAPPQLPPDRSFSYPDPGPRPAHPVPSFSWRRATAGHARQRAPPR